MRTIHKYLLPLVDIVQLTMPKDAQVLAVQPQRAEVYVWALVDTLAPVVSRTFAVVGTGYILPDRGLGVYVGTFQVFGGGDLVLVFHLFDHGEG